MKRPVTLVLLGLVVALATGCGAPPNTAAPSVRATGGPGLSIPPRLETAAPSSSTRTDDAQVPVDTPFAGRSFTVVGTGDVLLHEALWAQAQRDAGGKGYNFGPLLASAEPAVKAADLAICHLETPLGDSDGPFSGYPLFSVPPQIAPALAAMGYDSCSTASNHAIDKGERGVAQTLDALDAAHIAHSGTARSADERSRLNLLTVKGVVVAHLSYTFGFNGLSRPKGKEYLANLLKADDVLAEARRAKRAGAQVVIVSLHWGTEYQHAPTAAQTSLAKTLLSSPDVDLILGHHAHVVQPLARIGDKWVAYGMGNEVAWQDFSEDTQDGIMPEFTFTEVSPGTFRVTDVKVRTLRMWLKRPARVYDVATVLATPDANPALVRECRAALQRVQKVLGRVAGMTIVG
jgi:poly-gamma-glutamate synthesis protein (capsule biosynthesis protein)